MNEYCYDKIGISSASSWGGCGQAGSKGVNVLHADNVLYNDVLIIKTQALEGYKLFNPLTPGQRQINPLMVHINAFNRSFVQPLKAPGGLRMPPIS